MLKWKGEAGGWTVHLKFKVIQYLLLSENALHFLGPKHLLILFFLFGMSVFSPPLPTTYPVFKDSLPSSHETCPDPINQLWSFVCSLVHSTNAYWMLATCQTLFWVSRITWQTRQTDVVLPSWTLYFTWRDR